MWGGGGGGGGRTNTLTDKERERERGKGEGEEVGRIYEMATSTADFYWVFFIYLFFLIQIDRQAFEQVKGKWDRTTSV